MGQNRVKKLSKFQKFQLSIFFSLFFFFDLVIKQGKNE